MGSFRLSIYNRSSNTQTGGGADQLRFKNNGLTPDQLTQIDFFSDAGVTKLSITPTFYANGFVGSFGEVVPVPEPSTLIAALGCSVSRAGRGGASGRSFARRRWRACCAAAK